MTAHTPDLTRELAIYAASIVAVSLATETPLTAKGYTIGADGIDTRSSDDGSVTIAVDTPLGPVVIHIRVTVKGDNTQ